VFLFELALALFVLFFLFVEIAPTFFKLIVGFRQLGTSFCPGADVLMKVCGRRPLHGKKPPPASELFTFRAAENSHRATRAPHEKA
jgi:hypothetical protein